MARMGPPIGRGARGTPAARAAIRDSRLLSKIFRGSSVWHVERGELYTKAAKVVGFGTIGNVQIEYNDGLSRWVKAGELYLRE